MPSTTIPLILPATARGWAKSIGTSAKDQQLINGFYDIAESAVAGTKNVYVQKRGGSTDTSGIGALPVQLYNEDDCSMGPYFYLSGGTDLLNSSGTDLGGIGNMNAGPSYRAYCGGIIDGVEVIAFVSDGSGYYLFEDAETDNFPTFSASLTIGQATIVGISSTTGIYDGQLLSGSGIPSSTRVSDVLSSSSVLLSQSVTQGGTKTITKEAVAKIIDTDFPDGNALNFQFMNGYFFVLANNNRIYNSAINDPSSWASGDYVTADWTGAPATFLWKIGQTIAVGAVNSLQYYYLAGNSTGSVLSASTNYNVKGISFNAAPLVWINGVAYTIGATSSATNTRAALYQISGVNSIAPVSDPILGEILSDNGFGVLGSARISNKQLLLMGEFVNNNVMHVYYDPVQNISGFIQMPTGILGTQDSRFTRRSVEGLCSWSGTNTWTDGSTDVTLTCQTEPKVLNGGKGFYVKSVDLIADTEASGTASFSTSSDDGANWVSRNPFDMTAARKKSLRCGFYKNSVMFRVQHSAATNFRAQALVVEWEPASI